MTDILAQQAEIRARFHPKAKPVGNGGRFVSAKVAADLEAAAVARKQALTEELISKGLLPKKAPPGCTLVKGHPRHVGEPADDRQLPLPVAA